MSGQVRITYTPAPFGRIAQLVNALGPAGRKELNDAASAQLFADVRAHLRGYAASHHGSSNKLGATPTGHLERAASTMQHDSDADSATVSISSPGIRRVWGALTIRPTKARALTIPIHAIAYGRRVGEVARTYRIYRLKGTDVLAADVNGAMTPLYVLKAAVTLPQDRALLPSDAALGQSVKKGYVFKIRSVIEKMRATA